MLVDYHVHTLGHDQFYRTEAAIAAYCETALARGVQEVGFADHDYYFAEFDRDLVLKVVSRYPELSVRLGVEVDYAPGREKEIAAFLAGKPFDFVIGSVHQVDGFCFDMEEDLHKYAVWETTELFSRYFSYVAQAAESGLFDIIGHLDLIKIFNFLPAADILSLAAPALHSIRADGLCVEINTNGRYKPVREFYPSLGLLASCRKEGIAVTLGSDAHRPEDVGRDVEAAAALARRFGYTEIVTFCRRERTLVPLG